ncbi:hypothetical protein CFC21_028443 [Triticum aestivum]|nr:BSD domain-containing protein 1 [Aegilops tauschii subsp. strangulata]XP_044330743.1 BSD domain-containing protein 1-like [Triticum aestivum]KAF7014452.1 hypothetical protein CFC21_028443 [Triticum aestivum]
MDFLFNSLAAPDPASPPPEPEAAAGSSSSSPPADSGDGGGWGGFGGLLKTLTSQSETVLDAYRRDLAEFSTGLRRETDALREAAAQAARDLPSSALALDGLADIVAQGKGAIAQVAATAAASAASPPAPSDAGGPDSDPGPASGHLRYYSRFEAQLRALQSDPATFTADPEDAEDFAAWGAGFSLQERQDEIEALCYESDAVEGMVDRLVPDAVDGEVFWARYFYRVHKLKQQEDARAKLVKRVIAQEEEEDLSWEVDDEVEEEEPAKEEAIKQAPIKEEPKPEVQERENEKLEAEGRVNAVEEAGALDKEWKKADSPQPDVFGSSMVVVDKEEKEDASKLNVEESSDKKTAAEEPHSTTGDAAVKEGTKHETSDSSKDSDYSMVSRQRTATEEDLEWDEIEDLGEHEEKKGSAHGSSSAPKEELRKRLSVAEDDEDLSWDIEDDDDDKA